MCVRSNLNIFSSFSVVLIICGLHTERSYTTGKRWFILIWTLRWRPIMNYNKLLFSIEVTIANAGCVHYLPLFIFESNVRTDTWLVPFLLLSHWYLTLRAFMTNTTTFALIALILTIKSWETLIKPIFALSFFLCSFTAITAPKLHTESTIFVKITTFWFASKFTQQTETEILLTRSRSACIFRSPLLYLNNI